MKQRYMKSIVIAVLGLLLAMPALAVNVVVDKSAGGTLAFYRDETCQISVSDFLPGEDIYIKANADADHTVFGMTPDNFAITVTSGTGAADAPRRRANIGINPTLSVTATNTPGVFALSIPKANLHISATFPERILVTITAGSDSKTYDGQALTTRRYANTALATGHRIGSITITGSQTIVGESNNVPSDAYIVDANGKSVNDSYKITYVNGKLTVNPRPVTVKANDKSKTYDNNPQTDPQLTATVTDAVAGENVNYTLRRVPGQNVGDYAITVTAGRNPNYSVTVTNGNFKINPKTVTVKANDKSKTYDNNPQTDPQLTATVTDAVAGDNVNYTLSRVAGQNVGDYAITVTRGNNPNYTVNVEAGNFKITPKTITVKANDKTKVFDNNPQSDPQLTATVTDAVAGDNVNYTLSRVAGQNVGDYAITVTRGNNPNYTVNVESGIFSITQKSVTVKANDKTKTYDNNESTDPALTATVTGAVAGDKINYTLSRVAGQNAGDYAITVTAGANPNYTVNVEGGNFKIKAASLRLVAANVKKVYGEEDPEFVLALAPAYKNGDNAQTIGLSFSRVEGENVGRYAITPKATSQNYVYEYVNGQLEITKLAVDPESPQEVKLMYNGKGQIMTKPGVAEGGKYEYTVNGRRVEGLPTALNAGTYTIGYKFVPDGNHSGTDEGSFEVTILKADIGYMLSNLSKVWDGKPLSMAESEKLFTLWVGELMGEDKYDVPFLLLPPENYRDAGKYTFKIPRFEYKPGYPENYNVKYTGEAQVLIKKKDIEDNDFMAPEPNMLLFNGKAQKLVTKGRVTTKYLGEPIGTIMYATAKNGEYSETVPTGTSAGDYSVWYYVKGDKNHNDTEPEEIEVTIDGNGVVLSDKEDFVTKAMDHVNVTFTDRAINYGTWNVLVLPFEATVFEIVDAFGYAAVDVFNKDAADGNVHFRVITSGSIPAYTPFIIKTTADEDLVKTDFNQVVFEDVNIEAWEGGNNVVTDNAGNKFWGTFQKETKLGGQEIWYMSKGVWKDARYFNAETKPVTLKPFRAYVEFDKSNVAAGARIYVDEPDGTITSIEGINANGESVESEGWYTIDGKKLNAAPTQKGIYIKNGKKVTVK